MNDTPTAPNGTVLAVSGRRIDEEGAKEQRFPPGNEALVAARLRDMMVFATARAVVCSAACGADILALEIAAQLGLARRVVLPFGREQFRSTSVADRGEDWVLCFSFSWSILHFLVVAFGGGQPLNPPAS